MNYNWRKGGIRSVNQLLPHHQRLESRDGTRWAFGRIVKRSIPDHRFDGVEVWTLKHRLNGKVVTVATHRGCDVAQAWIAGEQRTSW